MTGERIVSLWPCKFVSPLVWKLNLDAYGFHVLTVGMMHILTFQSSWELEQIVDEAIWMMAQVLTTARTLNFGHLHCHEQTNRFTAGSTSPPRQYHSQCQRQLQEDTDRDPTSVGHRVVSNFPRYRYVAESYIAKQKRFINFPDY